LDWSVQCISALNHTALLTPTQGNGSALVGIILYILLNWSYTTAVFTDPGSTLSTSPSHAYSVLPTHEDSSNGLTSLTANSRGEVRFCKKCQTRKPDRSHHCSTCRRCVLKMDHHCPWLATCVGHRNYKPFLLFLIYTCLFCYLCFAVSLTWVMREVFEEESQAQYDLTFAPVNNILLAVVSGIFGIVLSGFTGWHIYLTLNGTTTIESMEKTRYMTHSKKESAAKMDSTAQLADQIIQAPSITRPEEGEAHFPAPSTPPSQNNTLPNPASPAQHSLRLNYADLERERERARYNSYLDEKDSESLPHAFDLGWRTNVRRIFGPSPMLWWLPVCNTVGDGWNWEASRKWQDAKASLTKERERRKIEEEAWQQRGRTTVPPPPPRYKEGGADAGIETVSRPAKKESTTTNYNDIPDDFLDAGPRRPKG